MTPYTLETEIDLGDIGIHHLDITAGVNDPDPENEPRIVIKKAVAQIWIDSVKTDLDVTSRVANNLLFIDEVLQSYLSAPRPERNWDPGAA